MHRITKNKITSLQIAVVVVFMAMAAFAAKPAQAQAGLTVVGGYKYIAVAHDLNYAAHVVQVDFMIPIGGEREGGDGSSQAFGFGILAGGNSLSGVRNPITGKNDVGFPDREGKLLKRTSIYIGAPLLYEYVFPFGLGITGGIGAGVMLIGDVGGPNTGGAVGFTVGVSDLGASYHFKSGWTLYSRVNLGYARFAEYTYPDDISTNGLAWGVGVGAGLQF